MESVKVTREEVKSFLSIAEKGYKCDFSCGYESGDGYGDGNFDGAGYDSGDGTGDSYGNGFGYGYGIGSGTGHGYGDDTGECAGRGGLKILCGNIVDYIDFLPTIITQIHSNFAKGYIVKDDLTLNACYIAKSGNSFAHGETLKSAVMDAERKEAKMLPIENRIDKFIKFFGPLDSKHTGKEFYDWHHILTGSCRMGRDEFCKSHNIDLKKMYSVRYFLDITKNAYGDHIINQIRKAYKITEE